MCLDTTFPFIFNFLKIKILDRHKCFPCVAESHQPPLPPSLSAGMDGREIIFAGGADLGARPPPAGPHTGRRARTGGLVSDRTRVRSHTPLSAHGFIRCPWLNGDRHRRRRSLSPIPPLPSALVPYTIASTLRFPSAALPPQSHRHDRHPQARGR